jgi:hypothetical protein
MHIYSSHLFPVFLASQFWPHGMPWHAMVAAQVMWMPSGRLTPPSLRAPWRCAPCNRRNCNSSDPLDPGYRPQIGRCLGSPSSGALNSANGAIAPIALSFIFGRLSAQDHSTCSGFVSRGCMFNPFCQTCQHGPPQTDITTAELPHKLHSNPVPSRPSLFPSEVLVPKIIDSTPQQHSNLSMKICLLHLPIIQRVAFLSVTICDPSHPRQVVRMGKKILPDRPLAELAVLQGSMPLCHGFLKRSDADPVKRGESHREPTKMG